MQKFYFSQESRELLDEISIFRRKHDSHVDRARTQSQSRARMSLSEEVEPSREYMN